MPRYGITLGYEKDKCSVCGKEKEIRYIYDSKEHKVVKVCDECVEKIGALSIKKVIEKYGEKTSEDHIKILTKEQLEKSGFELKGKKS